MTIICWITKHKFTDWKRPFAGAFYKRYCTRCLHDEYRAGKAGV